MEVSSNKSLNTVTVNFSVSKKVEFGKALYVVGDIPPLGDWNVENSLKLSWNEV